MRDEQTENTLDTLLHWLRNAKRSQKGNYGAAQFYGSLNMWLGIPAAILAAVVGTSVFATLESDVEPIWKIVAGLISIVAAILSSLQTFLALGDRSAKHRAAAAEYGAIKREIEEITLTLKSSGRVPADLLGQVRKKLDDLARETPQVPNRIWSKVRQEMPPKPFGDYFPDKPGPN
jgi:hypothetical protein